MKTIAVSIAAALLIAGCAPAPSEKAESDAVPAAKPEAAAPAPAPAAAPAAAAANVDKSELAGRIKRYYESSGDIPPDVDVAVAELSSSDIPGLSKGKMKLSRGAQSQEIAFFVSNDGRWFLQGDPVDLTVDPIAHIVETITVGENDPHRGSEAAAVTIVEYSDFQCPFCARAEKIVQEEVLAKYGDKVRFVYKQFPLTSIHPWAEPASIIGLCVFKQAGNDAYWKYHTAVFEKQKDIPNEAPAAKLLTVAKEAGADEAKVKACFEAEETKQIVVATLEEAEKIGVDSTPTFFINGRKLSGAQPLEAFQAIIDPELAKAGKS
jgi:protein-disulfide isomerase